MRPIARRDGARAVSSVPTPKVHMPTFRSAAALSTLAAALSLPASASALQTTTLKYQCKYPLIGVKALDLKVALDLPATVPAGGADGPLQDQRHRLGHRHGGSLDAVDNLYAIKGSSTAYATVKTAQGFTVPAKTTVNIPKQLIPLPIPSPLVLSAAGLAPSLTFDEPGVETIQMAGS